MVQLLTIVELQHGAEKNNHYPLRVRTCIKFSNAGKFLINNSATF